MMDQGGNIISHKFEAQRAVNVSCVTMTLQFNGNDLIGLSQQWQNLAKHAVYTQATMQQNQGVALAVNLII